MGNTKRGQEISLAVVFIIVAIITFQIIDKTSHSVSDTLLGFSIPAIILISFYTIIHLLLRNKK